jgi:hypothetical protein
VSAFLLVFSSELYALDSKNDLKVGFSQEEMDASLPVNCRSTYKGTLDDKQFFSCRSQREAVFNKLVKKQAAKGQYCEEVTDSYVICNSERYEKTKSTVTTLSKDVGKTIQQVEVTGPAGKSTNPR